MYIVVLIGQPDVTVYFIKKTIVVLLPTTHQLQFSSFCFIFSVRARALMCLATVAGYCDNEELVAMIRNASDFFCRRGDRRINGSRYSNEG